MPDETYPATVGANGRAKVTIKPTENVLWIVSQVSVEIAAAPVGATCTLRKNGTFISALIPTGDAAGGDPPIPVTQSNQMTVEWAGCTPGQTGTVFVVYDQEAR